MLKFITVIVICYFGKLENNKSSIFGPATIFWTRDNLPATRDTRRLDYLLIHTVRKSLPRFTRFLSLVLIRLDFTEIQPFENVKIYKEMYGIRMLSDTASTGN